MLLNDYYDYKKIKAKALRKNATKKDRLAYFNWLERYATACWSGEKYIDEGITITPIYEYDELHDCHNVIDVEIY